MANIVKTYSFVNGQPADATQVNQNFDDIIEGVGDMEDLHPVISAAGHALIDDADAAAQRATLGLPLTYATGITATLAQNAVSTIIPSASGAYLVFVITSSDGNANWHGAWYVNIGGGTPGSAVTLLGAAAAQCGCVLSGGNNIQLKNLDALSVGLSWSSLRVV